jgi:hypothetical protein
MVRASQSMVSESSLEFPIKQLRVHAIWIGKRGFGLRHLEQCKPITEVEGQSSGNGTTSSVGLSLTYLHLRQHR